jgi:GNAT superfamily N-acetyltransferase
VPRPAKEFNLQDYIIEPLGTAHDREAFSCGEDALDEYLKKQASQDLRRRAAATFILRHLDASIVLGYYTLSSTGVAVGDLPADQAKRLARYPLIPATLLARLAVEESLHGSGFGQHLLLDALRRSLQQSSEIGSALVIVDAKHSSARKFYKRYGFIPFPEHALRLFLPMMTIAKTLPSG